MDIFKEFSNKYNKNEDIKKASESDIKNLESEFSIYLPSDFKTFILNFGDLWTPDILDLVVDNEIDLNDVQQFWNIESIIFDKKNEWTSQISTDIIPFASDCMGSIFGFLTSDLNERKESVSVYFFDHDFNTVEKKSDSFSEWIDNFNRI
ncbi:SMI1/KNR4 family protein [Algibacter sp. 2305UL17-15]|uniref:SMI1/KNR4 family protein n=1 Tax=Algibacter sp. 2305UL17-15 TaxID=3231268 RepID=UPI00345832D7